MATEVLADFIYFERFDHPIKQPLAFDIEFHLGTKRADIKRLPVKDVRCLDPKACGLTIDQAGFEYVKYRSEFCEQRKRENKNFADHEHITADEWKAGYVEELKEILRKIYPDKKIHAFHPFGHIVRQSQPTVAKADYYNRHTAAGIATRVHGDVNRSGTRKLIKGFFGEPAEAAAIAPGRRLIYFSIWRPLGPVLRDPLGVVDARTVDPAELYIGERYFSNIDTTIETLHCAPTPGRVMKHQWYWMSDQTPDDVVVLKIYDSKGDEWEDSPEDHPFQCALHSAFSLADTEDMPLRESVEYRIAMVVDE